MQKERILLGLTFAQKKKLNLKNSNLVVTIPNTAFLHYRHSPPQSVPLHCTYSEIHHSFVTKTNLLTSSSEVIPFANRRYLFQFVKKKTASLKNTIIDEVVRKPLREELLSQEERSIKQWSKFKEETEETISKQIKKALASYLDRKRKHLTGDEETDIPSRLFFFKKGIKKVYGFIGMLGLFYGGAHYFSPDKARQVDKWLEEAGIKRPPLKRKNVVLYPREYTFYIERPETMAHLHRAFDELRNLSQIAEIAIIGPSGSGKSELAAEYADKYRALMTLERPDDVLTIKMFRAENASDLWHQYRDFARELGLAAQEYEDDELLKRVHQELKYRDHWLLVFDNIDNQTTRQNYDSIRRFIPQGEGYRGCVILTARKAEGLLPDDKYDVKVISTMDLSYRFSNEEANNLIDKVFGEKTAFDSQREQKRKLAETLSYLPQAIKKAAAYIKNAGGEESFSSYINKVEEIINRHKQKLASNMKIEQQYEVINQAVNELSLSKLEEENKNEVVRVAWDILSFAAFLNPDQISYELLQRKLDVSKKIGTQDFIQGLELLERYCLLEEVGDDCFKIHRSLQETMKDKISQTEQLNDILGFMRKNFVRDNVDKSKKHINSLFIAHVDILLNQVESIKIDPQKGHYLLDKYYFKMVKACHYLETGRAIKARAVLIDVKQAIEKEFPLLSNNITSLTPKQIERIDIRCMTIYAQILYNLGRSYFYLGGENIQEYYNHLERAVQTREKIDARITVEKNQEILDASYNDCQRDSRLVKRNGILEFRRITEVDITQLEDVAKKYWNLYSEEKSKPQPDMTDLERCLRERFRVYCKIALLIPDNVDRSKICDQAVKELYQSKYKEIVKDITKQSYEELFNKLVDPKEETRPKYLNDMGHLLLAKGDEIQLTEAFYKTVISMEESTLNISLELADAYLGIAKLYQKDQPEKARRYLERFKLVKEKLQFHHKHYLVQEADKVREEMRYEEALETTKYIRQAHLGCSNI